ncbi:hypothetical protein DNTS_005546 [Danionella cerebrum]|uniref:Fibronectin type-III domain-containing protein n=1 Tax=Danionella cerebrum TaxID=2873325 RepID=A0A553NJS9_9TELE|nr:hypothetical protein DNTS_005546 [Danionella translucida]
MSRNKISQLHVEALKGLSSLNELMIDRNELTEVPSGLLDPLEAIEHLDLSENHISHIDPSAFGHLLHLKILKLNNNRLKVLSERVLSVNRALLQVDLNGNNWTCDCRMEKLKNWLTQAHSQGNLLNMFVHCLHPKVLAGKNLDYVSSKQLGNLSSCDSKPIVSDESVAGLKEEREKREGGKHVEIRVQADEMEQGPLTILQSKKKRKPFRSRKAGNGSYSDSTVAPFLEGQSISASQEPLKDQANNHVSRVLEMITDACQFNQHSILNVCVKDVTSSSATVHWSTTPDDELLQGKELNFRILFDRFGHAFRFPRYVYTLGSEQAVTLQELHPDSTYVTCVESVVDGTVCQVAPRDHCVGFVTLLPSFTSEVNLKVVTAAALVGNALLLLLIGGFWLGRALKRKIKNRKLSTHRHVHHMYSTRLPFRSAVAKTCVSSEFSGYQSGRPLSEERDLIQFPNDRFFHNSPTQRNEDAVMFRCSN